MKPREPAPSTYPSVQAFVREAREGVCPLCDEKMPPRAKGQTGRLRVHCGSAACLALYAQLAAIDSRRRKRQGIVERVTRGRQVFRVLECGHEQLEVPGGRAAYATHAKCITCEAA